MCSDGDILKVVKNRRFDYVVASHVVEHAPNPLRWLKSIFEILEPGGVLCLVVPDKRFTFDFQRPITTFGQMIEAYFKGYTIPPVAPVYDHFSSALNVNGGQVWSGLINAADLLPLTSESIAWTKALDVHERQSYNDVHVNIFTPWSFFEVIKRAIANDLFHCEICAFRDTLPNQIEFLVGLKKPRENGSSAKIKCSNSIPVLTVDSFISPYMPQVASLSSALEKSNNALETSNRALDSSNSALATATRINEQLVQQNKDAQEWFNSEIRKFSGDRENLELIQKVLDRKSIKFTLRIMHFLFSFKRFVRLK